MKIFVLTAYLYDFWGNADSSSLNFKPNTLILTHPLASFAEF